jgi:hypothetical protein
MPLTPSRFALLGRMTLPLLVATAFFGPSIAAFATCRPVVAVGVAPPPPIPVIRVHPFLDVGAVTCGPDAAVHDGPREQTGRLSSAGPVEARMLAAATRCLRTSSGFLTLSVSIDANGNVRDVEADTGGDDALADCARSSVRSGGRFEARGPGTLMIGYYTGLHGQ